MTEHDYSLEANKALWDGVWMASQRKWLESLIAKCKGNIFRAAQLARTNRSNFYHILERHGLDADELRRKVVRK